MSDEEHFLVKSPEEIQEKGLVVIENNTGMPIYDELVLSPFFMIILNHRGSIHMEYDYKPFTLSGHDFSLIYPNHLLKATASTSDYLSTLIVLSPQFLALLRKMFPDHFRFEYHFNHTFHLNEHQYKGINACFQLIKVINSLEKPEREELLATQVDFMAHLTEIYMRENNVLIDDKSGVQQLLLRFHALIAENYNKNREVKFYAEQLCLSPKYFGTLVRKATGYSAIEWIAIYVIVQAKHLLRHHLKMTVQQISDRLGFADQTAFTHYFKSHSGQTPQEYRAGK